ncbi:MAG: thiol-disulfide oxidoreductase DCC family protein [Rufibacter sp.]
MNSSSATIYFDGVCNLCNGFVQFVIAHDRQCFFRFASLQSDAGQQTLQNYGMATEQFQSFLLVENGTLYTRSSAALRVLRRLTGGWPLLYAFIIIPKFLRDPLYDLVARNRYRWFGRQESCMLPTPELKARFL